MPPKRRVSAVFIDLPFRKENKFETHHNEGDGQKQNEKIERATNKKDRHFEQSSFRN